ncbi:MAG TPA: adenine phosphoribosyltransferase [Candidatus Limousia pullorum]|uniref:Adenine phosphoribosyltransferase n=1 Tax=Candidatus Limousia pullorum TaxID=2840860 RepID=A0A9D1S7V2_9FIRM|nr:phosphoribosyltransferase family protein [Anaeromassilibacillus sp. An172]MEE0762855.1 phosphoribosyltransferase family protein [Acutalibacteraceae bacterium]OUP78258.1 adenine phosphoribosyltransferase [Anaeromassilibacillus sp. An172]HIU50120.1 adenine phosphoribosyltransferase [Candidatus Limousia pullorum]
MNNIYTLNVAGCVRELPLCEVSDHIDVAAFIMFGDVELTEKVAQELMKKCPEHDILLSAEAKGIPLVYEMARIGCRDYVVARKGIKTYMKDYIGVEVKSITTAQVQRLYLSGDRVEKLRGKRVLIIDDVISTGESLKALEELAEKAGANVVGKAAVLAEGEAADRDDIIFLEKLPLFYK